MNSMAWWWPLSTTLLRVQSASLRGTFLWSTTMSLLGSQGHNKPRQTQRPGPTVSKLLDKTPPSEVPSTRSKASDQEEKTPDAPCLPLPKAYYQLEGTAPEGLGSGKPEEEVL